MGGHGNSEDAIWPVAAEDVGAVMLAPKLLQNLLPVLAVGQAADGDLGVVKSNGRKVQDQAQGMRPFIV